MNTVKDWVEKWKNDCGLVKEPDDVLLFLRVGDEDIYEGHFLDTPEALWDREVYEYAQVIDSTDSSHRGAYRLTIAPEPKKDEYLEGLYTTLELCDLVIENADKLSADHIAKARKLKEETKVNIAKREAIPLQYRL